MADETEETTVEPGRYEEPREKADPEHKDAGQLEQERREREREEREQA